MRIAQLTDLHLVESRHEWRTSAEWRRLRYLNTGREIDPARRRAQAISAFRLAAHADHVLVTGDLTEEGTSTQFEILAEVLDEARVRPDRITLVPGNHDLYAAPDGFSRALAGPLRPYKAASTPGVPIDLGEATLLPISTALPQTFLRSAGALHAGDAALIDAHARKARMLIVAQHHPPMRYGSPLWNWIDGIENAGGARALVARHDHLHVVHGHLHRQRSRAVAGGRPEQVHCAAAVLESAAHVRFYELDGSAFRALDGDATERAASARSTSSGAYPSLA